jgi:enoyl-CoA hydratase/carnithine racemase
VYEGFDSSLEEAGEREGSVIAKMMATRDGREGIAAFVEKRPPNFEGR